MNLTGYFARYPIALSFFGFVFVQCWILWAAAPTFVTFSLGFTVFRWDGRCFSASDVDVPCCDIFILCKRAGTALRSHEALVWTVTAVYKLKTPTWGLETRPLSPRALEPWHVWWRWCRSVLCPLGCPVVDVPTCSWPVHLLRKGWLQKGFGQW